MGCLQSTDEVKDEPKPSEQEPFDEEEKEDKPTAKLSGDDEIPEMNVNRLKSGTPNNVNQAPQNIAVTQYNPQSAGSPNRGAVIGQQSSVLNNFQNMDSRNNYDPNQYNTHHQDQNMGMSSPHSTNTNDNSQSPISNVAIPEHRMMDSHGNVHVNKFYNVTRNHNLSNASKFTDMSEMPSVFGQNPTDDPNIHGYQHMHNLSTNTQNMGVPIHKMSIDSHVSNTTKVSNGTTVSKVLWDDDQFSERASVITMDTAV